MFSFSVIAKIFIATLLAGSIGFPIIRSPLETVSNSIVSDVLEFIFSFVFYYYSVSWVFNFFVFAFGGGVGRYDATKLYRRIQWVTFGLIISLPVSIIATLLIGFTPLAPHSDSYFSERKRILDERALVARQEAQNRYNEAVQQREMKIDALVAEAKAREVREIESAAKPAEKKAADEFNEYNRRLYEIHSDYKALFLGDESTSNQATIINLYLELMSRYRTVFDVAGISNDDVEFHEQFEGFSDELDHFFRLKCEELFELDPREQRLWRDRRDRSFCLRVAILASAEELYSDREGPSVRVPDVIRETQDIYRRAFSIFPSLISSRSESIRVTLRVGNLTRSIEIDREEIGQSVPPVRTSDFRPVTDTSNIVISDANTWERVRKSLTQYSWFIYILISSLYFIFIRRMRPKVSRIYRPIRQFLDEGRRGFGGSARFATMFEEWAKPYEPNTLYMGRSLYNPREDIGLKGEAHMLTVAGSRGGKGSTAIIPNLLRWPGSVVVIDPKGTNARVTAGARRAMGQDVHLIDPYGIVTQASARFDPLDGLEPDDPLIRERIISITDALVIPDEDAKEKHWDDGARTMIAGFIAYLISQNQETKHLYEIRNLIQLLPEQQDTMWAEMALSSSAGNLTKDAALRYIRGQATNEILSILSSTDKHSEWLSSPIMQKITSNPTFRLSDIKRKPTTIYLIIPPRQLQKQARLIRLFINLLIDEVERGGKSKIPILMLIDEFLALGKMNEFPDAFATMASYNLVLWPFVQDLGKMQSLYGDAFSAFEASSRGIQVFSTTDLTTLEFISKKMGNRPLGALGGITKSNDNVALRSPDDIEKDVSAETNRQYILQAGSSPTLIEKVPYYTDTRFKDVYDPDPDFADS